MVVTARGGADGIVAAVVGVGDRTLVVVGETRRQILMIHQLCATHLAQGKKHGWQPSLRKSVQSDSPMIVQLNKDGLEESPAHAAQVSLSPLLSVSVDLIEKFLPLVCNGTESETL